MRVTGYFRLISCVVAICGGGYVGAVAGEQPPAASDAIVSGPASTGQGNGWNAARLYALFEHVPAPPTTLAQAGALVGSTRYKDNLFLIPTGEALTKSRTQFKGAMAATNAAELASIKAEVAQPQAVAAQQLAEKMQGASRAQQIQMAMQLAGSMPRPTMNVAAMRAAGTMASYNMAQRQTLYTIASNLRTGLAKLESGYAARHVAANQPLVKLTKACPKIPYCGDTTDCNPQPACIQRVNTHVPALVAEHRQIAQSELDAERAMYLHAKAELQPILAREEALTAAAEQAGASAQQLQMGYGTLIRWTGTLQAVDAAIVTRAGFWQGIRATPVPDDFSDYYNRGPWGYSNAVGPWGNNTAPQAVPDNW